MEFSYFDVLFSSKHPRIDLAIYVIGGLLGIFAFHFMINIGMAMGIMPVTGIPLYFVSYGGSSLWTGLISIGILTGISARRYSA